MALESHQFHPASTKFQKLFFASHTGISLNLRQSSSLPLSSFPAGLCCCQPAPPPSQVEVSLGGRLALGRKGFQRLYEAKGLLPLALQLLSKPSSLVEEVVQPGREKAP